MNMKKIIFSLLTIIGLLIFTQTDALACSCLPNFNLPLKQQVNEARKTSDAVFSAKVIEITKQPQNYYTSVKLIVENSWKGNITKEITISTGLGGAACGYPFEIGKSYLIYAYGSIKSKLSTGICSRTTILSNATKDLKILGKGKLLRNNKL